MQSFFRPAESFAPQANPVARSAGQGASDPLIRPGVSGSKNKDQSFYWFAKQTLVTVFIKPHPGLFRFNNFVIWCLHYSVSLIMDIPNLQNSFIDRI